MSSFGVFVLAFGFAIGVTAGGLAAYATWTERKKRKQSLAALRSSTSEGDASKLMENLTIRDYISEPELANQIDKYFAGNKPRGVESRPETESEPQQEQSTPASYRTPWEENQAREPAKPLRDAVNATADVAIKSGGRHNGRRQLRHGEVMALEEVRKAETAVAERSADIPPSAIAQPIVARDFGFLFPELQQDPDNLLPETQYTADNLVKLGEAMIDDGTDAPAGDSDIPAAYTYFGQFISHDITLEAMSATLRHPLRSDLVPLPLDRIKDDIWNFRTAPLDLQKVYGLPTPRIGSRMRIGSVTPLHGDAPPVLRPPSKDDDNDLPREPPSNDVVHDRAALIGDPRNDENLISSQLHVAFLRAHNRLVDETDPHNRFGKAKRRLRRHYQYIVLHDFLKRIADPQIVDDTIKRNRVYDPDDDNFFLPLEYSVAAYRFGHSMVRAEYEYNVNFNTSGNPGTIPATLALLFTFTALSGQLEAFETLPENWIIEWENFFPEGKYFNRSRRIDTELVEPLEHLTIVSGQEEGGLAAKLAVRNLLRGYLLRMPTGQAVARALRQRLHGVRSIPVLTEQQIRQGAANQQQIQALEDGGFLERTPLWYYILAEAAVLGDGQHLGPVGGTIVAEVLVGLVRRSPDSILDSESNWEPNLPSEESGTFTLADLLRFAGVLGLS